MVEDVENDVVDLSDSDASDTEAGYRLKEDGCYAITEQKKYYWFEDPKGSVVIKRNLTPSEYVYNNYGDLLVPYMCPERMKNEVAAIRYIQRHTTIPTPNIRCAFEDHGRYYIITDLVPGLTLPELPNDKKAPVIKKLEGYIAEMHTLKSRTMGGVAGDVILPYRLSMEWPEDEVLKLREADTPEFVFCHNDLSQHNVLVDETTLKVNAIIDWEYAGFFPPEFDGAFYLRPGPSVALDAYGEVDDVPMLLEVIEHWKAE
ncbi:hypothetical protein Hypma_014860 [Hypsizygus marmoreus]|uniref:Aminoglycoside phosphotransferase domain-containing protein n=1 Tax=Hypsizygus marmoreus TaxID=39966 RepID=A0A369K1Y6_HYPMA|nr:hypothetical protein Hypma_014860 [Hypsizygus marmoreus]